MKDTITVRKDHVKVLTKELKDFFVEYEAINETETHIEYLITFATVQQLINAGMIAGMAYVGQKAFSESELTQV